jgi:hypothetical protein
VSEGAVRIPPKGGWPCRAIGGPGRRAIQRARRGRITVDGVSYCLACGRQMWSNLKHLTGGWYGQRWRTVWHHFPLWSAYGGCS